jgi:hypothetical protein
VSEPDDVPDEADIPPEPPVGEAPSPATDGETKTEVPERADDDRPDDDRRGGSRRPGRTALFVAAGLAVTFFLSTVVLLVVSASLKSDKDELTGERRAVSDLAGQFVETFVSYDYENPEAQHDAVLALSAPPFSSQFEDAFAGLQELFTETQSTAQGTVKDVFVGDITDDGTASAIVVYDRVIQSSSGTTPEVNVYLRLDLVKLDGEWKVSGVINLNFALTGPSEQPAVGGDTSTTATTAAP